MHLPHRPPLSPTDDDEEDVSAPRKDMPMNLNQSIFQFFTQARGRDRLGQLDEDDESGDDEIDMPDRSYDSIDHHTRSPRGLSSPRLIPKLDAIDEKGAPAPELDGEDDADLGPAPFMSQILEARAEADSTELDREVHGQADVLAKSEAERAATRSEDLEKKLMEIFMLPGREEVISGTHQGFPCISDDHY